MAATRQDWNQVAASLKEAKAGGGTSYTESINEAWAALERREEGLWWLDGANHAYELLFPVVGASRRWEAVARTVLADHFLVVEARIQTIQDNLDAMCLLAASETGLEELCAGVDRLLDMHTLWIEGGGRLPALSPIPLDASSGPKTWQQVLLAMLLRLLEFDEQTYSQAALRGIAALLRTTPALLNQLLERVPGSTDGVARRLLLITEYVAAEGHGEPLNEWLARLMAEAPRLDTALSAWSALVVASRASQADGPSWPEPTEEPQLVIASSAPLISGACSRTGLHESPARSSLSFLTFLESACGESVDDVASEFASSIRDEPPTASQSRSRTRGVGDRVVNPRDEAETGRLFEVLRKHERKGRFVDVDVGRLAQALVPAADPFVFLRTPAPHSQANGWPIDAALDERMSESPEKLAHDLVAFLRSDLPDDRRVLGGSVTAYSRKWDVKVLVHHHLPSRFEGDPEPPRVLNARTSLMLRDFDMIFGPGSDDDWLTWGVFGLFPFSDGLVDVFPSPRWRQLGWQPSPADPTRWIRDGTVVAWHERLLGPVRSVYASDLIYRHPIVTRWVCALDEWNRLRDQVGEPEARLFPVRARCDRR